VVTCFLRHSVFRAGFWYQFSGSLRVFDADFWYECHGHQLLLHVTAGEILFWFVRVCNFVRYDVYLYVVVLVCY